MKQIKKVMALVLALAMVMGTMSLTAFAAGDSYKITIDNAVIGETYKAYKVFDVTYSGTNSSAGSLTHATGIPGDPDGRHEHTAYSYTINKNSNQWWGDLTNGVTPSEGVYSLTDYGIKFVPTSTANVYNVLPINADTGMTDAQAAALAAFLATKTAGKTAAASGTATGTKDPSKDYTLTSLELDVTSAGQGYYFVDTSTGALCSLDTTEPNATIREKNSLPSVDKKVSDAADGTFGESTNVSIGDKVYYKTTVTDGVGTDADIVVHDKMAAGLTLDSSTFAVKNGSATVPSTNYEIKTTGLDDDCTFEVTLKAAYVKTLDAGVKIDITYTATLNADAVIAKTGNDNETHVTYSNQTTTESHAKVYTYALALEKYNAKGEDLDGAVFTFPFTATQVQAGTATAPAIYKVSNAATGTTDITTPKSGVIVVIGLKTGTYSVTEKEAPEGYNKLTAPISFTVKATDTDTVNKTFNDASPAVVFTAGTDDGGNQIHADSIMGVLNQAGTELPSTGGMGTTIFYILGAGLVIGAIVLLVARKKAEKKAE